MSLPTEDDVYAALSKVIDPEIHLPITELEMVRKIEIADNGDVSVHIDLTIPGCPLKDKISADAHAVLEELPGIGAVTVTMGAMNEEQRRELREKLAGAEPQIPFSQPGNLTRVIAVTSGKGGVGKSTCTANLALALSEEGYKVGVLDADVYGFSIPRMLGVSEGPKQVDSMIVPPVAQGIKVMSIGMFVPEGQAVIWRGPMLHRAMQQFLADVYWGDLDVLLLDLPPGTGDIAITIAQLLPNSEILIVTTPQVAAAEVAGRAGLMAKQTQQRVLGVIENMSYLENPDGSKLNIFGEGGGAQVAADLSSQLGYQVDVIAQIPIDVALREASDNGDPLVGQAQAKESASVRELRQAASKLMKRSESLVGKNLGVSPV